MRIINMISPIQRISQKFTHIEIIPNTGDNIDVENQWGGHSFVVEHSESDPQVWFARLSVQLKDKDEDHKAPYHGVIEVVGQFKLDDDFPEETVSNMMHMNAGAILYGAIREIVYSLTSRSLHNEAQLPILDARCFIPSAEDEKAEESQEAEKNV